MKGFNFEKNLNHQTQAIESTIAVFQDIALNQPVGINKNFINPVFNYLNKFIYRDNIKEIQAKNNIHEKMDRESNIIDIMMETGTGKTYTYAKTIFELNKQYDIFKFIVVVPTLSIKAGTIDFLKSDSSREHFKEQYEKTINVHIVESQKSNKSKKSFIPPAISNFVNAGNFDKQKIQVMIINAGMINSDTMQKSFDKGLFDKYSVPCEAIAAVNSFMIVDEPHKFGTSNKTWENIRKLNPQFILRYGATFPDKEIEVQNPLSRKKDKVTIKDYHNLIYQLTAVDSFNKNLVKGVIGHITEFDAGQNALVKFIDSDGMNASFELSENNIRKNFSVAKSESLSKVHSSMTDVIIEKINKSEIILSNGLEMKKGDKLNPYCFAITLQEMMIQKAIKHHFELEKKLLTRDVKIKPLTLFFIDNIDEYRKKDGNVRRTVEQYVKAEIEELIKSETDTFYKDYLEKTLLNISETHAGYFSKDNTEKDEIIEKEINEILHDKQEMLSLENPRRFIFSKWTLREGWDNPNVFQICKLRSSGSEISKLQEVGRGLRLPVNEFGNRVKDEPFFLNYFVDFTESDFVDKLVNEINQKSGAISIEKTYEKLTDEMISQILEKYEFTNENELLGKLITEEKIIDFSLTFIGEGFEFIKQNFSRIFEGINSNKIRKATDVKKKIIVRTEKYKELKDLWEKLNEKVILEYKFENEIEFKKLFIDFLKTSEFNLTTDNIKEKTSKIEIRNNRATICESESIYGSDFIQISTMKYSAFLKELAQVLNINMKTLHQSIIESKIEINSFLNKASIRIIKQFFDDYLMTNAFNKFSIEYKSVTNKIHPTKLTDENGNVLVEISASDVGVFISGDKVADSYFFNEMYYDSELEKTNIGNNIREIIVFTKIPKNSIKIPVSGSKSYSPDFAYVLNFEDGKQKLHFIVETKHYLNDRALNEEEIQKIKHAEKFFGSKVKIEFRTQFSNDKIIDLIKKIQEDTK